MDWRTQANNFGPLISLGHLSRQLCLNWRKEFAESKKAYRTFQGQVNLDLRCAEYMLLGEDARQPFKDFERQYSERYFSTEMDVLNKEQIVMYRYPTGVGFTAHHDVVTNIEKERAKESGALVIGGDITVIALLSTPEEYEGGELYFPNHGITIKPPIGTCIAFPATEFYLHGVRPIVSGERFSVVCRSNEHHEHD